MQKSYISEQWEIFIRIREYFYIFLFLSLFFFDLSYILSSCIFIRMHIRVRVNKDLFKWLIYCAIIATRTSYLVTSLFDDSRQFLPLVPRC